MTDIKIGALCWNQYTEWPALLQAGIRAEELGFDDGWLTEGILNPNFVLEPVTYIAHLAALTENLDRNVVRDPLLLDEATAEIEFDLGGAGETDFDFLEPDPDEHLEVFELLLDAHAEDRTSTRRRSRNACSAGCEASASARS